MSVALTLLDKLTITLPTAAPGVQGPKGDKGDQGQKGADSTVPGPRGLQGEKGDTGERGQKGDTGPASTVPGPKGEQGDRGDRGLTGAKGDQGDRGLKGDTGNTGAQGRGIKTAYLNSASHLILVLTDDVEIDVGEISGSGGGTTPTPSPAAKFTRADTDSTTNPPKMLVQFPDNIPPSDLIGETVTFRRADNSGFSNSASLVVVLTEAHFDSQTYNIDRAVDIDLSELYDDTPAGPFYTDYSADVDGYGTIQSPVYFATLNSPATTINVVDAGSVNEGNSGSTTLAFPVSSIGALGYEKKADWTVVGIGDSPTSAADFISTSGTITIPAGQDSSSIAVQIAGDTAIETDEMFKVVLSNVRTTGYAGMSDVPGAVGATDAQGTITNDDESGFTTALRWARTDNTSVSLADNDTTAVGRNDAGQNQQFRAVKANISKTTGRWYVEMTIRRAAHNPIIGFNHDDFDQYIGHLFGFSNAELGTNYGPEPYAVFYNNTIVGRLPFHKDGDVIGQAWDLDAQRVYILLNGTPVIGDPANPSASPGIDISSRGSIPIYPACAVGCEGTDGDRVALTATNAPPTDYSYI